MRFVYADELKQRYRSYGQFYQLRTGGVTYDCRRVVDLLTNNLDVASQEPPDALLIMMNPGSSSPRAFTIRPLISRANLVRNRWPTEWQLTEPDNAQYQLMRLMQRQEWQRLRLLNLCDLRQSNSQELNQQLRRMPDSARDLLCISTKIRLPELQALTMGIQKVVFAWGQPQALLTAAQAMSEFFPTGIGMELQPPFYRFASPYRKDQKLEWLEHINARL